MKKTELSKRINGKAESMFDRFSLRCIEAEWDAVCAHWRKAKDEREFADLVLADRRLAKTQAYAELFAGINGPAMADAPIPSWWFVGAVEQRFSVWSECGSVSVSHDGFSASFGHGDDGFFAVIVATEDAAVQPPMFDYLGSVSGGFEVSGHEVEGRFGVFGRRNMLVLKRWN